MGTREEQEAKIQLCVQACLDDCRANDQPYTRVRTFFQKIQDDPNWTDKEIIELETRVIRMLLNRQGCPSADTTAKQQVQADTVSGQGAINSTPTAPYRSATGQSAYHR